MWGGMMAWMLIFWVVVVVFAIWLAAWLFPSTAPHPSSAREILDARYARGELSREEYRQMRQELSPPGGLVWQRLRIALIIAALLVVLLWILGGWGMHGPWGPWYHPGPHGWYP
ncbi:MAG TPA: SHOCT domain-containing protein [bacterium]|nr:SHOCT domain-containing protein [bacterium]